MKAEKPRAAPLRFPKGRRRNISTQFGALCWRRKKDRIEVLLVTSRGTGRWLVPKGWPIPDQTPPEAAAVEAFEEAGVTGVVGDTPIGLYTYTKASDDDGDDPDLPCAVALYPLEVTRKHGQYPEKSERRRKWVSRKKAARLVQEPELKAIIRGFDPG